MNHFDIEEFSSPDKPGSGRFMDKDFLENLDKAREIAGTCFVISSGYRTEEHNKKVGGSKTSSHLDGLAVDIECNNSVERHLIIDSLYQMGFSRIGVAKTFIHVDCSGDKPDVHYLYTDYRSKKLMNNK